MMTELICVPSKRTSYGGVDEPVGYKRFGGVFVEVEPVKKEFSKTHRHGRYCWRRSDIDLIVVYGMTNSGKCYVDVKAISAQPDKEVIKMIKEKWCLYGEIATTIHMHNADV